MRTRPQYPLRHPGVRTATEGRLNHVSFARRASCAAGHKSRSAGKHPAIRFTHILVVADSSGASRQALSFAKLIAARTGSTISLLGVVRPIPCQADFGYGPVIRHIPDDKLIACLKRRLMALASRSFLHAPPVMVMVRCGLCEHEILKTARELNCDLIVLAVTDADMAASPHSSVAEGVIRLAHCPVLVIRQRERCARHGTPHRFSRPGFPGAERAGDA